ncbi:MAG: hypothetical protein K1X78_08100 [Verrucomicrobiaceae bacterium]|nr:hypothetical protein [Verrucomicrobiaceae bacterium]
MLAPAAHAQRGPRINYIYPAGAKRGTSVEVTFGGQFLDNPTGVISSGEGVTAQIIDHDKPPPQTTLSDIRDKLREMQSKMRELRRDDKMPQSEVLPTIRRLLREAGISEKDLRHLADFDRKRNDPKQQQNQQISETVRVKITLAEGAAPGFRFLRLRTASGLSNPLRFAVGQHDEVLEVEPERTFDFENYSSGSASLKKPAQKPVTPTVALPVTINGRILPGEVDHYTFHARKDEQVVLSVQARHLIPYLADAVPGWFQAVVSLQDSMSSEVAFAGGYRFDPDPVVFFKIPEEGDYHIEVHDSIYRGREDFVYRLTVGELPFLVGITPLGMKAGTTGEITFQGGNLGDKFRQRFTAPEEPGIILQQAVIGGVRSNAIPFQVDAVNEEPEHESNDTPGSATEVKPPMVVNGRIDKPGDVDYYRVNGRGSRPMVFEIFARRLGSPLDSTLTAFDIYGKQIGTNDDHEDPTAGLTTHHADSRLVVDLPPGGMCVVRVSDTQHQGGISHAYRLKVTQAKPSFALRVTPSSVNAAPGGSAKLTVHALRMNGFDGEIKLQLKSPPSGFDLRNATIPAGKDNADVALAVPSTEGGEPVAISVMGSAEADGDKLVVDAVPAEDMMQAFIYRHLVPVDALLVDVRSVPEKEKAAAR